MKKRDYTDYVTDILSSIEEAIEFTGGMTFDEFSRDKKTVNAVIRSLEVLGEAAGKIPEDIRQQVPDVPWEKKTCSTHSFEVNRGRFSHDYMNIIQNILNGYHGPVRSIPPILSKSLSYE